MMDVIVVSFAIFCFVENDYTFSGVDANDFETFSLCLVASLKNFLGDQARPSNTTADLLFVDSFFFFEVQ